MNLGKNSNVLKATKTLVRKYCLENGCTRHEIAEEFGILKGTLDNKLKASDAQSSLYVEEVLALSEITDDNSILKAMCAERGLVVFDPIETMPDGGDVLSGVLMGVLQIDVETGSLSKLVHEAMQDGKIDAGEAEDIATALASLRSIERKLEIMLKDNVKEQQ